MLSSSGVIKKAQPLKTEKAPYHRLQTPSTGNSNHKNPSQPQPQNHH